MKAFNSYIELFYFRFIVVGSGNADQTIRVSAYVWLKTYVVSGLITLFDYCRTTQFHSFIQLCVFELFVFLSDYDGVFISWYAIWSHGYSDSIGQPQSQVNISDGQQQSQQPQPSYYSPARGDPAPLITPMMYSGSHRPGVMPSALPMSAAHFRYGSGAQLPVRSTTRTSSRERERASSRRETSPRIRASSRSISAGVPQAAPAGHLSAGDWHAALEEVQNALDTANRTSGSKRSKVLQWRHVLKHWRKTASKPTLTPIRHALT